MGLSFSYLGLSGVNAKERNAGAVIARFTDKEGYPITLVHTQGIYGGSTSKPIVYIGAQFWTFNRSSILGDYSDEPPS